MSDKLAAALHEASVYGIGATSDFNQKIILEAAQETNRLRGALTDTRQALTNIAASLDVDFMKATANVALGLTRKSATWFVEITVPLCEAFRAIGIDITEERLRQFEKALYERGLNVAPRQIGDQQSERTK